MNSNIQIQEDGIDLVELFNILIKHKIFIIVFTLLISLSAGIYTFIATKWYKAEVTLSIGKEMIRGNENVLNKYFIDTKKLKQILDIKYDTKGQYKPKHTSAYINTINIPKTSGGLITIVSYGKSNKDAVAMIKKTVDYIMDKDNIYFNPIINEKKKNIEYLTRQIKFIKNVKLQKLKTELDLIKSISLKKIDKQINFIKNVEFKTLQSKIKECKYNISQKNKYIDKLSRNILKTSNKTPSLSAITAIQLSNLENEIARLKEKLIDYNLQSKNLNDITLKNLEKTRKEITEKTIPAKQAEIYKVINITIPQIELQISKLQNSIKPPYIVRTSIIGKIYTKNYPAKPKKKLIIVLTCITGLILSIFIVFFIEFIK